MEAFTLTCTLNQNDHFHVQLDILYRAWKHAVILFAVVFVAFWAVFFADYSTNGTWINWGITGSLLYFMIVVGAMVAVYLAYSPLHAWIKSRIAARSEVNLAPYTVTIGKDKITVKTSDGGVAYFSWFDLKVYRETKRFLILRDRRKKNQTGQLILPKRDVPPEQIKEILAYREAVIRADEIKKNPVARERANQERKSAKNVPTPVADALKELDDAEAAAELLTTQELENDTQDGADTAEAEHGEKED